MLFARRERQTLRYFVRRCHAEGVSKAAVVRRNGAARGLASERSHVRMTLARSGASVLGVAAGAVGDARGRA